jgi:hypothetical protein
MRRRSQWVFNGAAALSAMLFITVSVLWVRSYDVHERIVWRAGPNLRGLIHCNGRIQWKEIRNVSPLGNWPTGYRRLEGRNETGNWEVDGTVVKDWRVAGIGGHDGGIPFAGSTFGGFPPTFSYLYHSFAVPHWSLTAPTLVLPAWWLLRFRRHRRRNRLGLCRVCGYDLRATLGRCPECGTAPAGKETS